MRSFLIESFGPNQNNCNVIWKFSGWNACLIEWNTAVCVQCRKNSASHFVSDLRESVCVCVCLWEQTVFCGIFGGGCFQGSACPMVHYLSFIMTFFRECSVSDLGPGMVPAGAPFSPSRSQLIILPSEFITFHSASESSSLIFLQTDLDASSFYLEKYLFFFFCQWCF